MERELEKIEKGWQEIHEMLADSIKEITAALDTDSIQAASPNNDPQQD